MPKYGYFTFQNLKSVRAMFRYYLSRTIPPVSFRPVLERVYHCRTGIFWRKSTSARVNSTAALPLLSIIGVLLVRAVSFFVCYSCFVILFLFSARSEFVFCCFSGGNRSKFFTSILLYFPLAALESIQNRNLCVKLLENCCESFDVVMRVYSLSCMLVFVSTYLSDIRVSLITVSIIFCSVGKF